MRKGFWRHPVNRSLAEIALRPGRKWTDRRRLATFATTALILDDRPALTRVGVLAMGTEGLLLDPRLLEDIATIAPREEMFALVEAIAATHFPPNGFRRLLMEAFARRPGARERGRLGFALRLHVAPNHRLANRYRHLIHTLLRSRTGDDRLHALELVSRLDRVGADDMALVASLVERGNEGERMNAVNALTTWMRRPSTSENVKRFARGEQLVRLVRRLRKSDASKGVRSCAGYYLKAIATSQARPRG
jgi:hypothetical protein